MNNLLYNTRMALRDIMEVNIFTKGSDRVYVTVSTAWGGEGDGDKFTEAILGDVVRRLHDMDLALVGGDDAIPSLRAAEPVEITRKAA